MIRDALQHATAGRQALVGSPFRLSGQACASPLPPPALGQHTREVLTGLLGLDDAEVDSLGQQGII